MITMVNAIEDMLSRLEMTRLQQKLLLVISVLLTIAVLVFIVSV